MTQGSGPRGAVATLSWKDGALHLIDQRKLPLRFQTVVCKTAEETAQAIADMVVRGAPAIGAAAAYGMALGAFQTAAKLGDAGAGRRAHGGAESGTAIGTPQSGTGTRPANNTERGTGRRTETSPANNIERSTERRTEIGPANTIERGTERRTEIGPENGGSDTGAERAQVARFVAAMERIGEHMRAARPTAVNLGWAVARMLRVLHSAAFGDGQGSGGGDGIGGDGTASKRVGTGESSRRGRGAVSGSASAGSASAGSASLVALAERLLDEAHLIADEDRRINRSIGRHGAPLLEPGGVLHHCNTGALATVDYGTALGVIRAAHEAGTDIHVYPTETRPFMQGARLTTWELLQEGIPTTLITDSMAAHVMAEGKIKSVVVGADRVTANGDVVNKIGTYGLAVLAKEHGIPFYVAAPVSTLDLSLKSGADVVIEERDGREVTHILDQPIAPEGVGVYNPAFDVTPARFVTAIITEYGVVRAPYEEGLASVVAKAARGAAEELKHDTGMGAAGRGNPPERNLDRGPDKGLDKGPQDGPGRDLNKGTDGEAAVNKEAKRA